MPVQHIHTYLVHPGKGSEEPSRIGGTTVQHEGKLFDLLNGIYEKSNTECDIDIAFNPRADGTQQNPCRDLLLAYLQGPTLARGRQIAERLEKVTTHRSKLGLLFIIAGVEGAQHKLVISRFPADSAILAEENQRALSVEFLERVFMKSATSYKAALYQDRSLQAGFWSGKAIDKQVNSREVQLSEYWIADFLDSDFRTTAAAGTRRLAVAIRNAAKNTRDVSIKKEIAAAATLAGNLHGMMNMRGFAARIGLSDAATAAIVSEVSDDRLINEQFQFDREEFQKQAPYRSVEVDSGAFLTAPAADFDAVFQRVVVDERNRIERISTQGRVTNEKIGKSRER